MYHEFQTNKFKQINKTNDFNIILMNTAFLYGKLTEFCIVVYQE